MINQLMNKKTDSSYLIEDLKIAISTIENTSNKLILVLRQKADKEFQNLLNNFIQIYHHQHINIGFELSKYIMEHGSNDIHRFFKTKIHGDDAIILDNAEILFDPYTKLDPFILLKSFAKGSTVIAIMDGSIVDNQFIYGATPNNDYKQYSELNDTYILDFTGETK